MPTSPAIHFASHGGVELDLSNLRDLDADLQRRTTNASASWRTEKDERSRRVARAALVQVYFFACDLSRRSSVPPGSWH